MPLPPLSFTCPGQAVESCNQATYKLTCGQSPLTRPVSGDCFINLHIKVSFSLIWKKVSHTLIEFSLVEFKNIPSRVTYKVIVMNIPQWPKRVLWGLSGTCIEIEARLCPSTQMLRAFIYSANKFACFQSIKLLHTNKNIRIKC